MQKKRKITKKSKRRLMIFGIPALIFIIYFCITLISYVYNYTSLRNEEKKLNSQLHLLQEEKKQLKNEIQMLNDTDYIIRYAKEKYLYSTNGEYVIKLNEDKKIQEKEEQQSYTIYIVLSVSAVILCGLFLRKKKTK